MLKTVGNPSTRFGDQTIVDGNLVIGTAGKGIDFSASTHTVGMTSELLNDYEEGTFTPVLSDGAGNNATAAFSAGRYTKVGRVVTLQFYLININTAGLTAGNTVRVSLPFTIYAGEYASSGIRVSRVAFSVLPVGYIANGAAFMNLNEAASGADGANILVSALTSGQADIMCAISYLTAS